MAVALFSLFGSLTLRFSGSTARSGFLHRRREKRISSDNVLMSFKQALMFRDEKFSEIYSDESSLQPKIQTRFRLIISQLS